MGTFEEMKYKYTDLVLILHLNGKTLIGHHCCCFLQNCTNIECLQISCVVGRLGGGESAVLKVRSRLWAKTFLQRKNDPYSLASLVSFEVKKMPYKDQPAKLPEGSIAIKTSVIWATPNVSFSIPLWVIILAILLGLLVLAILTLALWKCGFFDRARPPQDDMTDREQLTNEKTPEAWKGKPQTTKTPTTLVQFKEGHESSTRVCVYLPTS